MVQIAIYNDGQHEQYRCLTDHVVLREHPAGSGRWSPVWEADRQLDTSDLLFRFADNTVTFKGDTLPLPCLLQVDATWIEITSSDPPRTLVPLKETSLEKLLVTQTTDEAHSGPSAATVTKWLTDAGQLHRAAAGSEEFYADAARFAVETVGLDAAWVLRPSDYQVEMPWQIVGSHLPHPERGIRFDPTALEKLAGESTAWYQPINEDQRQRFSQAIVIAPVLDKQGQLVAAIYGVRDTRGANRRRGVRPLEARLVQLLAESVAVGIARIQQETEAARTRVLLEQAFSPTVAEYIQQHPESLSGQECDVTLMFADLRGYTTLAETMTLTDCYDLLGDVMEALTQVVVRQRGVVVDYYGDGLLALWNAPLEQPNHADLACAAALDMFEALPPVAQKWQDRLDAPLELGIGIHSGPAYVGNAGTSSRIKYGPRGNTVNVASRVQAASKQLQLPLVITSDTQTKLTDKFFTLRVCTAKLPGLEQPAELFTVYPATKAAQVKSRLDQYSQALAMFERGDLEAAETLLDELKLQGQATPAHFLAHYTATQKKGNLGRRAVDKYAGGQGPVIEIHSK
ncbi:MAG: adenylate/guanylate cyclase domain-containing protein [Planctomycetes bacterium]|nr:adenylate/guanylate cyclase domain-containing protein [Planctomycetota bacterium]